MPLSKKRNRERMALIRLHKQDVTPREIKPVQPRLGVTVVEGEVECEGGWRDAERSDHPGIDADGNPIPDY